MSNVHIYCHVLIITHYIQRIEVRNVSEVTVWTLSFSFPLFQCLFLVCKSCWFNKGTEFHKYFVELILSNYVKYSYVITLSWRIYLSIFLVCRLCALRIRKLNQWMFIKLLFQEDNCGKKKIQVKRLWRPRQCGISTGWHFRIRWVTFYILYLCIFEV